jgi:hypothetical protein
MSAWGPGRRRACPGRPPRGPSRPAGTQALAPAESKMPPPPCRAGWPGRFSWSRPRLAPAPRRSDCRRAGRRSGPAHGPGMAASVVAGSARRPRLRHSARGLPQDGHCAAAGRLAQRRPKTSGRLVAAGTIAAQGWGGGCGMWYGGAAKACSLEAGAPAALDAAPAPVPGEAKARRERGKGPKLSVGRARASRRAGTGPAGLPKAPGGAGAP